nr:hypothetical protein [Commensalibacter sp. B14384M3]
MEIPPYLGCDDIPEQGSVCSVAFQDKTVHRGPVPDFHLKFFTCLRIFELDLEIFLCGIKACLSLQVPCSCRGKQGYCSLENGYTHIHTVLACRNVPPDRDPPWPVRFRYHDIVPVTSRVVISILDKAAVIDKSCRWLFG